MTLADRHIATIKPGAADFEDRDNQSRVYFDGKVFYYDTTGMTLEAFQAQVEAAFNPEGLQFVEAEEWGASNIYRADVN